jgi:hypothetical protein
MFPGLRTVIYPVAGLVRAKVGSSELFGGSGGSWGQRPALTGPFTLAMPWAGLSGGCCPTARSGGLQVQGAGHALQVQHAQHALGVGSANLYQLA